VSKLDLKPFEGLGAEVFDVDLSTPLDGTQLKQFIAAWHAHQVLVVRNQKLTDPQLAAFSANFGVLERAPVSEVLKGTEHVPGSPEVAVISNVLMDGIPIGGLGDGEASWHTDMSYIPEPPPGCVLYSLEIPSEGADTWFADMYAAYDLLPERLKQRIERLQINHDASTTSAGEIRRGFNPCVDVREAPGARHPIVMRHPHTGRRALFLGRRLNAWVVELPVPESQALLDELWEHAIVTDRTYTHKWRLGDMLMWDNRCVMHRRDGWNPQERRVLHRTQINSSRIL
jgi:taurine dioxygenase